MSPAVPGRGSRPSPALVVGVMSGTSADGIDVALVEVEGEGPLPTSARLRAHRGTSYEDGLRSRILAATRGGTSEALCDLRVDLAEAFARAVGALLADEGVAPDEVEAIGSHGQTVWHRPPAGGRRGATLQLGDPATLAAGTGIGVVSDLRSADMAAGGEGAPLVPWADAILLARGDGPRVVLNVGGIANLTWLPARGEAQPPVAFDTGPGNVLLDTAAARATGGRLRCDRDGALARAGSVDPALLDELLADPFFGRPPPRSTGRERFGPARVDELASRRGLEEGEADRGWPDLLATLTTLTARSVADAVERWVRPRDPGEVVVTGGGARNPALVEALATALDPVPVRHGPEVLGPLSDAREAAAFALLAWAHLRGVPGNVPGVTGARGPRILGSWTPAP